MNTAFAIGIGFGIACFYLTGINALTDPVKPRRQKMVYAFAFFIIGFLTCWCFTKI